MKISIRRNLEIDAFFPVGPVRVYTGYALPIEVTDVPRARNGLPVAGVRVGVTNANGVRVEAEATPISAGCFHVLFSASNFANYGEVANGVTIDLKLERDDGTFCHERVATGRLHIVQSSAAATPGSPTSFYVVKGDRVYVRSQLVGDVQHYVEQTMEYDADIGWGANWTGDYILSASGDFIPAN